MMHSTTTNNIDLLKIGSNNFDKYVNIDKNLSYAKKFLSDSITKLCQFQIKSNSLL